MKMAKRRIHLDRLCKVLGVIGELIIVCGLLYGIGVLVSSILAPNSNFIIIGVVIYGIKAIVEWAYGGEA
jgi:hypothetical protein